MIYKICLDETSRAFNRSKNTLPPGPQRQHSEKTCLHQLQATARNQSKGLFMFIPPKVVNKGATGGPIWQESQNDCLFAYIAGFLDGDGCINAQIIRRIDYRLGFQIRVSITFFQSTKRHWFLLKIQQNLPGGSIRKRKDGISEYTIVGPQLVQRVCEQLRPYLQLKQRQANLIIEITKRLKKNQSRADFLTLCHFVDQIGELNDSKKRIKSATFVQSEWDKLFPVETSASGLQV